MIGFLNSELRSSNSGLSISSGVIDFVSSDLFLILVIALIIVKIAHRAIKSPLTVRGPLKIVLGTLTGVFYYLILTSGVVSFTVSVKTPASGSFEIAITLLITLVFLELSAIMTILQGVFEYHDGRMEGRGVVSHPPAQVVPST